MTYCVKQNCHKTNSKNPKYSNFHEIDNKPSTDFNFIIIEVQITIAGVEFLKIITVYVSES